jgi:hypothetical protein
VSVYGQAGSAYEFMKKYNEQISSDNEVTQMTMLLFNKQNNKREREIVRYLMTDKNNKRSSLIKFLSPADVKGTGLLAIENMGREDDQWLYLPGFNKTRRIASSNETDYFVGSDFTFEDLNREDLEDFNYEFLQETDIDEQRCYQIKATPITDEKIKESGYARRDLFIRKDNFVLVKVKFYDKSNSLFKEFKATSIKMDEVSKKWRAYSIEMSNLKTSHKTVLDITGIKINKGLDKETFTQRNLQK